MNWTLTEEDDLTTRPVIQDTHQVSNTWQAMKHLWYDT